MFLTLGLYQLARVINRRVGREVCNPLLFATLLCCAVLLLTGTEYETYYESGADVLELLLTPATICLAIPLYRQVTLLKRNAGAVAAGCVAGVAAHMLGCVLMLALFQLDPAEYATLLPKSITTAIGKGLSEELGGYPAITMVTIMITGLFGAVALGPGPCHRHLIPRRRDLPGRGVGGRAGRGQQPGNCCYRSAHRDCRAAVRHAGVRRQRNIKMPAEVCYLLPASFVG